MDLVLEFITKLLRTVILHSIFHSTKVIKCLPALIRELLYSEAVILSIRFLSLFCKCWSNEFFICRWLYHCKYVHFLFHSVLNCLYCLKRTLNVTRIACFFTYGQCYTVFSSITCVLWWVIGWVVLKAAGYKCLKKKISLIFFLRVWILMNIIHWLTPIVLRVHLNTAHSTTLFVNFMYIVTILKICTPLFRNESRITR